MSFLSRLGLQSVSFSEQNHGTPENPKTNDQSSDTAIGEATTPERDAPDEDDDDRSQMLEVLETEGAVFQQDLIVILPEYEAHFFEEKTFENTVMVFKIVPNASIQLVCTVMCDYFIGFLNNENRKQVGRVHYLSTGTHLLRPDPEEDGYVPEYKLL